MKLDRVPLSDGVIESVITTKNDTRVALVDWKGNKWLLRFIGVLAVVDFNVEGEDIDGVMISSNGEFMDEARRVTNEPSSKLFCFGFFDAWTEKPRLRIVAEDCDAVEL
jgi:hypothetical protein